MYIAIVIINLLLMALYAATLLQYGLAFFKESVVAEKYKTPLLLTTLGLHIVYLGLRTAEFRHVPVTSLFELMSVFAFALSVSYYVVEKLSKVRNTGFFVLSIATLLFWASGMFTQNYYDVKDILKSELLASHILFAMTGFSAFALSAIYGFMYLILYGKIRSRRFDIVYRNLPSLETLVLLARRTAFVGFSALTFVIVGGTIWLPKAIEKFSYTDIKVVSSIAVWFCYGVLLLWEIRNALPIKTFAKLMIAGFIFVCISMALSVLSEFHNFH